MGRLEEIKTISRLTPKGCIEAQLEAAVFAQAWDASRTITLAGHVPWLLARVDELAAACQRALEDYQTLNKAIELVNSDLPQMHSFTLGPEIIKAALKRLDE